MIYWHIFAYIRFVYIVYTFAQANSKVTRYTIMIYKKAKFLYHASIEILTFTSLIPRALKTIFLTKGNLREICRSYHYIYIFNGRTLLVLISLVKDVRMLVALGRYETSRGHKPSVDQCVSKGAFYVYHMGTYMLYLRNISYRGRMYRGRMIRRVPLVFWYYAIKYI